MGLLDKAADIENKPAKAAKAKAAKPKAAKPKAAKPKAAKPKAAKPKEDKPKAATRRKRQRGENVPKTLPDEFVLAGRSNRAAAWLVNFAWNWGVLIAVMSILIVSGSGDLTWPLIGGLLLPLLNVIILPVMWGRNIGQFISRTKYVNHKGEKPFLAHAVLANINTPMIFAGFAFLAMSGLGSSGTQSTDAKMIVFSLICFMFPLASYIFKRFFDNDFNQSVWDLPFSAYLVHHVPTGKETGWLAKMESLGDFGAKRIAKMDEKRAAKETTESDDDS